MLTILSLTFDEVSSLGFSYVIKFDLKSFHRKKITEQMIDVSNICN